MHSHQIACHECDLLIQQSSEPLSDEVFCCPRCHHKISGGHKNPLDYVIALSITGAITLIFANLYPFLAFEAQGQSRTISLADTTLELFVQGFPVLALLIFIFIVLLPLTYLLSLLLLTVPIKLGLRRSPPIWLGRFISSMLPWAMGEVFIIGVLVALVKIISMATIIFGLSFWAYILFTVLFLITANIVDKHRLWSWVMESPRAPEQPEPKQVAPKFD